MTTDKAFKRVVRARMAKTGERYAAARRTLTRGRHGRTARGADGRRRHPDRLPDARRPAPGDGHAGQRPGESGRRLGPDGRAVDRGRDPRHRRRPGRRLHPLGVQEPRRADPHPRVPEPVAIPVDPRLDRQDARSARHRARRARDRRRERRSRGARCPPGRRRARHRLGRPAVDRDLGPARRAVGVLRPGRRRLRTRRRWLVPRGRSRPQPVPGVAGRDGRRAWTDRLVQAPDRRAANDARTDPGRTASGGDARWPARTRWITCDPHPTPSRSRPGASGAG